MNDAKERRRGYGRRGTDTFRAEQEMKRMTGQLSEPSGGLREIATKALALLTCEPEGELRKMAFIDGRMEWYEKAEIVAVDLRKALAANVEPGSEEQVPKCGHFHTCQGCGAKKVISYQGDCPEGWSNGIT